MNTNLLNIVKQIIVDNGESILDDPQRLKGLFSDLAKDEPKSLRIAFGRCMESGAYTALKNAPDVNERKIRKVSIAQQVRDQHGLDMALCAEALDILEAALFGTSSAPAYTPTSEKAPPAAASPSWNEPPLQQTNVTTQMQQSQQARKPNPFEYYAMAWEKYAVFSGRSRRAEFWWFVLFNWIANYVLSFIDVMAGLRIENIGVFSFLYTLAVLIPSIALGVRRMHDVDKRGPFLLIPIYNIVLAATGVHGEITVSGRILNRIILRKN